jgi:hypothetical protein
MGRMTNLPEPPPARAPSSASFSHGRPTSRDGTFLALGLEQKYVVGIIIAVVLAAAIVGGALILRPRPESTPTFDPYAREIACLEGGGEWDGFRCHH